MKPVHHQNLKPPIAQGFHLHSNLTALTQVNSCLGLHTNNTCVVTYLSPYPHPLASLPPPPPPLLGVVPACSCAPPGGQENKGVYTSVCVRMCVTYPY